MLNTKADNLRMEAESAIQLRKKHTRIFDDLVGRFAGNFYRDDWQSDGPSIDNHEFEFLVNIMPAVMANNPKVSITSRRPVVQRELTKAMQHGVNRWIKDINLKRVLEPVIEDAVFKFGAALVTMEPLPGHESKEAPPLRPTLTRISPKRFFMDPQAERPDLARFMGHISVRDRDDLINAKDQDGKPKYDREAIEQLAGPEEEGSAPSLTDYISDYDLSVDRDQVITAEIYVPETRMIYSIGFSSAKESKDREGAYLRKPRRYFGHPRGPYILFGFYIVPDQVYPLSPLCVTAEVVEELNAHSEQVRRQASRARNLVLVDGTNAPLADAITNFGDGTVASVPHFDRNAFAEISLGGPAVGQLDYVERLREQVDRRSGLTDIQRGNVSGEATATEAKLAAAASSGRVRHMQNQIQESVRQVLENVAWLMFESKSVVFPVSQEKAEKLVFNGIGTEEPFSMEGSEEEDVLFLGGKQKGQEDYSFFDLELEIDPYSMEQVDEAVLQKRMETAVVTVTKFAPLMLQFPFINWPELLDDYFQQLNITDGRKYVNFEMLMQMLGIKYGPGALAQIPGLDGAPPVDPTAFTGQGGQGAGATQQPTPGGADMPTGDAAASMAGLLGGAGSAA